MLLDRLQKAAEAARGAGEAERHIFLLVGALLICTELAQLVDAIVNFTLQMSKSDMVPASAKGGGSHETHMACGHSVPVERR